MSSHKRCFDTYPQPGRRVPQPGHTTVQPHTSIPQMALELHVWGPAFGLDSIDPECLGAITCFRRCLPREDWTLIASNDAAVSPDCKIPPILDPPCLIKHNLVIVMFFFSFFFSPKDHVKISLPLPRTIKGLAADQTNTNWGTHRPPPGAKPPRYLDFWLHQHHLVPYLKRASIPRR